MKITRTSTQNAAFRFSDVEMRIAKETDLPDLLSHLGYQVQRLGNYYTTKEMDSIRIKNRRTWRRYSTGQRGDAITFVQEFCDKSFPEAVNYLLEFNGHRARDPPQRPTPRVEQPKEKPPFVLPTPNWDQRRVFAYLQKRGIDPQVIRDFIQTGLLYEDALYHNCVFVGKDGSGQPRFASKRGTCDLNGPGFKGDVTGSDKSVAFPLPCDPALDWVVEIAPQTEDMFARCLSALKPPPELTLSQWADMYRMLSAESSATPGRWHTDNAPYQREIMDAMGDPHVRKVVIMTAAQIGKTAMLMNLLGYYMHYYPAPAVLAKSGDCEALMVLWDQVKCLVFKQANRWAVYGNGGVTVEDLMQAGFIAVLLAVSTFDPTKGTKFSTYLFPRLRAEFTAATGWSTKRGKLDPLQTAASIDMPLDDEGDATLVDFVPDPAAEAALRAVEERDRLDRLHADLEEALSTLKENEQRTVRAHYYQGQTLEQISVTEGTSKSNVARWEQAALRHLRHPARSKQLMVYL